MACEVAAALDGEGTLFLVFYEGEEGSLEEAIDRHLGPVSWVELRRIKIVRLKKGRY